VSTSPAVEPSITGARKATVVGTILLAAFVYSLNARGSVLESEVVVQAFALDRYKIQWINGPEGVAGLTCLFLSIYLMKVVGARRVFLAGAICLTVGCLGEALARTPWQLGVAGIVRTFAALCNIPGLTVLQRLLPQRRRFTYCTFLALVFGGQVVVESFGSLLAFSPSWRAEYALLGVCGVWFRPERAVPL
jgi:MFS family permease